MCSVDFDPAEVFSQTLVRHPRKKRRCYECGLAIPVGSPCIRTFRVYDGDAQTTYAHAGCDAVADWVRDCICKVEHEREQTSRPKGAFPERFEGAILVGGLGEEIDSLQDYYWPTTPDDVAECRAMGVEFDEDDVDVSDDPETSASPTAVATWLWDIVRAEHRAQTVAS